jgi:hypothetical protein
MKEVAEALVKASDAEKGTSGSGTEKDKTIPEDKLDKIIESDQPSDVEEAFILSFCDNLGY